MTLTPKEETSWENGTGTEIGSFAFVSLNSPSIVDKRYIISTIRLDRIYNDNCKDKMTRWQVAKHEYDNQCEKCILYVPMMQGIKKQRLNRRDVEMRFISGSEQSIAKNTA